MIALTYFWVDYHSCSRQLHGESIAEKSSHTLHYTARCSDTRQTDDSKL